MRPVFGVDEPPPPTKERMSYVARASCGHVVALQADTRPDSLTDFLAMGIAGLTVERISQAAALEGLDQGSCSTCNPPDQPELPMP